MRGCLLIASFDNAIYWLKYKLDCNISNLKIYLEGKNCYEKHAKAGIQKSVNGGKVKMDVKETTVITFMQLLFVMLLKQNRLTKTILVQGAKIVWTLFGKHNALVLSKIIWTIWYLSNLQSNIDELQMLFMHSAWTIHTYVQMICSWSIHCKRTIGPYVYTPLYCLNAILNMTLKLATTLNWVEVEVGMH